MRIFISGGCKNGKSYYAQHLAKVQCPAQQPESLYYIATMKPADTEDNERINRHRHERQGWGFKTVEQHIDIEKILDKCNCGHSFLLDSLTALLANEMFLPDGKVNEQAAEKISAALLKITGKIKNIVIVSDYIYGDAIIYDTLTEKYRKSLAKIDRAVAGACDILLESAFTNLIIHKGNEMFGRFYEKIP